MAAKVSVIVPVFNVEEYLEECLDSILAQTLEDLEVICVNDGSTDSSLQILKDYAERDSRIKIIDKQNAGYGAAMNDGFDAATGEYVGIVEPDDYILPEMFETLYNVAHEDDLDFVKSDFYRFTKDSNGNVQKTLNKLTGDESYYNVVVNPSQDKKTFHFAMNTWCGVYKRTFLEQWHIRHNETPGASYQDNGFWFQTFCRATRAMFLPQAFYMNRRDNPNSSIYSTGKMYAMSSEYDFIRSIIDAEGELLQEFIPLCNYFRFCGYRYNTLNRIPPASYKEFIRSFSEEFKQLANKNELDENLFGPGQWHMLMEIMYEPERFRASLLKNSRNHRIKMAPFDYVPVEENAVGISVIVPVYNVSEYLAECLDSILEQEFKDIEVICVDDGSTDGSLDILKRYAEQDLRVKIFFQENSGPSRARNYGLSYARGRYVLCVDADDALAPEAFSVLFDHAEKTDAEIVVFGIKTDYFGPTGESEKWIELKNPTESVFYSSFLPRDFLRQPACKPFAVRDFIRRDLLIETDVWFNELFRLGEDTLFQFDLFPRARRVAFVEDKLYLYRCIREDSAMAFSQKNANYKAEWHAAMIEYVLDTWSSRGYVRWNEQLLLSWAIDFLYWPFIEADKVTQSRLAKKIIPLLRSILGEAFVANLQPVQQERWRELANACLFSDGYNQEELARTEGPRNLPSMSVIILGGQDDEVLAKKTFASIFGQTACASEVLYVDPHPSDTVRATLREMSITKESINVRSVSDLGEALQLLTGEYLLLSAPGVIYTQDAFERMMGNVSENPVGIMQFPAGGSWVIDNAGDSSGAQFVSFAYYGSIYGRSVFDACYKDGLFDTRWHNKLVSADLVKNAFGQVPADVSQAIQLKMLFFATAYNATLYRGIVDKDYLEPYSASWCEGEECGGSSVRSTPLLRQYMEDFLIEKGTIDLDFDALVKVHDDALKKYVDFLNCNKDPLSQKEYLQSLVACFGASEALSTFAYDWWDRKSQAVDIFKHTDLIDPTNHAIKKIGIYYHKMIGGGVEKVIEYLAPLFKDMGYEVLLISDIQGPEDKGGYTEASRVGIPAARIDVPEDYRARASALVQIIKQENLDLLIYNAWNSGLLLWDWALTKACGCSFVVHTHSIFMIRVLDVDPYFADAPMVYSLADGVICLSKTDKEFWGQFNSNVYMVQNPLPRRVFIQRSLSENRNILWVGRLEKEKRPEDALEVFARVHAVSPQSTLTLAGKAASDAYQEKLIALTENLDISDNVMFVGFQEDMNPLYEKADVLLMTSEFEGYPMALAEAVLYGLPVVMYDLPHLQLLSEESGILTVPQLERREAANQLIRAIQDKTFWEDLSQANLGLAEKLSSYDYRSVWNKIIESCAHPHEVLPTENLAMWMTLLDAYRTGATNKNDLIKAQRDEYQRLKWSSDGTINVLQERVGGLREKNKNLREKNKGLRNSLSAAKKQLRTTTHKLENAQGQLKKIKGSRAYKLSCALTKPYRVISHRKD